VQMTNQFDYPIYLLSIVLFSGCLLWLAIDPEKQLPAVEVKPVTTGG
jgi:hypothetical protein